MERIETDPEDASIVTTDLKLSRLGINVVPESIGALTVRGNLVLENNEIRTLPETIGNLTLEGFIFTHWDSNLTSNPHSEPHPNH